MRPHSIKDNISLKQHHDRYVQKIISPVPSEPKSITINDFHPIRDKRTSSQIRNDVTLEYRGKIKKELFQTTYGNSFVPLTEFKTRCVPYPDPVSW